MGAGAVVCRGLFVGGFSVMLQAAPLPALLRAHARGAPIKELPLTHPRHHPRASALMPLIHSRPRAPSARAPAHHTQKATPLEKRDAAFFNEPAFA